MIVCSRINCNPTNSANFISFRILTIIFILVWVLIVSSIKIVFFIIFMGMVENAHQWMWIYSIAIHTFFFAIIFECLRWSPCALNSWVVSWVRLGLDRTGHMSFLTKQDRTPKFAGPDWIRTYIFNILPNKYWLSILIW